MPAFLSDSWIEALDAAGREAGAGAGPVLVLEQRVRGVPGRGDVAYHVVTGGRGLRVRPGPADRPDVTLTTDHAGAVALARGETTAQHLLAAGRLRVGGDVGALVAAAGVVDALGDVFARVRDATTFD